MKTFSTSRQIAALPEIIFAAVNNPESLAKWWGPAGFTNTFHHFEFKEGGKWVFTMHGPDGTNYPNENEFTEIIPNEKVVIAHVCEPLFSLTILIEPKENGSLVQWIQAFENEELAEKISSIVIPANEQNLDRLTEVVCKIQI
ncbi:MAG: SRPBCC domain-containing protein [Bacteroidales bacterium]|nr:SRPBCC domain-containing protein [Bacteroidales bacterium]